MLLNKSMFVIPSLIFQFSLLYTLPALRSTSIKGLRNVASGENHSNETLTRVPWDSSGQAELGWQSSFLGKCLTPLSLSLYK